jgi:Zn-dependent protease
MDHVNIIQSVAIWALPLVFAVSFHEAAHGFIANRLGDPTARMLGRLSLNPIRHIDLWGTIIIPLALIISQAGILFGYAKPVPVNPRYFKNPKKSMAWVAFSGPCANFSLALVSGIVFRIILWRYPDLYPFILREGKTFAGAGIAAWLLVPLLLMLIKSVQINVILAVFNLLPIPPLDGGQVIMSILPDQQAKKLGQIAPWTFLIVVFFIILDLIVNHQELKTFKAMGHFIYGIMDFLSMLFLFG